MELRINKDTVSHIKIHDFYETKYRFKNVYVQKHFFGIFGKTEYPEGYWQKGEQRSWNLDMGYFYLKDSIDHKFVDRNGTLYEKPEIEIFCGEKRIKRKFFESFEEAQKYCKGKFPNVTVIFKD